MEVICQGLVNCITVGNLARRFAVLSVGGEPGKRLLGPLADYLFLVADLMAHHETVREQPASSAHGKEGNEETMRHKWMHFLFSILMIVSTASCGPALSSPLDNMGSPPPLDTSVDKPMAISPTATPTVESRSAESSPQHTVVPLTQPQPSVTPERLDKSGSPVSVPFDSSLQQLVTRAKEDLAKRLGVPIGSITVGAVIGQEFSTDAFYCRTSKDRIARDESPLVMSGQSILLSALAHRYEYHASDQTVIFCRPLL